jgi:hypothetical protein
MVAGGVHGVFQAELALVRDMAQPQMRCRGKGKIIKACSTMAKVSKLANMTQPVVISTAPTMAWTTNQAQVKMEALTETTNHQVILRCRK